MEHVHSLGLDAQVWKNGFTRPITGAGMKPAPHCAFIARDSGGIFAVRYVGRSAGDGVFDPNTIARLTVRRCAAVDCARVLQNDRTSQASTATSVPNSGLVLDADGME